MNRESYIYIYFFLNFTHLYIYIYIYIYIYLVDVECRTPLPFRCRKGSYWCTAGAILRGKGRSGQGKKGAKVVRSNQRQFCIFFSALVGGQHFFLMQHFCKVLACFWVILP